MSNFKIAIYVACVIGVLFAYGLYKMPKKDATPAPQNGSGQPLSRQ